MTGTDDVPPGHTGRWPTTGQDHPHYYVDGRQVPSVTQILPSPDLARAAAHVTAAEAIATLPGLVERLVEDRLSRRQLVAQLAQHHRDQWDLKAQLGTDVHHWALEQCWTNRDAVTEAPWHIRQHLEHWAAWLADTKAEPVHVEACVVSARHRYAGTLDAIARIDGQLWLLDIKTGRRIPETAPLQLAAYRWADHIDDTPMPPIDRCAVIHLTADRCQLHELQVGPHEWDAFRAALDVHRWMEAR